MKSLQEIIADNLAAAKRAEAAALREGDVATARRIVEAIRVQENLVSSGDEVEEDAWMNEGGK